MGKYKKLFSDVGLFAISNFGSKILVFLLVPLYTNLLTPFEYGVIDLLLATVNLISPVLTLAISEAVLRFSLDKEYKHTQVLFFAYALNALGFIVLICSKTLFLKFAPGISDYWGFFLTIYLLMSINSTMSNFVRGIDKTRVFAINGLLYTFLFSSLNILFLVGFKIGLLGYFFALIIAESTCILYMLISSRKSIHLCEVSCNCQLYKEMLRYSIPMIPTIIAWWVMQVSDKYIVIHYHGLAASGIYGISYKIPTILSIITSIFIQAWQISAIKSVDDQDNDVFVSSICRYFLIFAVLACSGLILLSELLGYILFAKEYFVAWTYVPILLIAYLFSGLSGVLASVFSAHKKTNILFHSTLAGALTNLVLNFVFIPQYGPIGAAYTTMLGFIITCFIRISHVKKLMDLQMNGWRDILALAILGVEAVIMSSNHMLRYPAAIISLLGLMILYRTQLIFLINKLMATIKTIHKRR